MLRIIDKELFAWKKDPKRKTLLIRGARQVGKTYSVRKLGQKFKHLLEINLEENKAVHKFFEESLTPQQINEKLSVYFNIPIRPQETLLFFDEIQACPNALRSLRFYFEKMPELHVVAAGSLLEFALSEIPSFGVGRISSLYMYPLTFSEFLWALDETKLHDLILNSDEDHPLDDVFHQRLLDRFKTFQVLSGMPAVLQAYIDTKDVRACQISIDELISNIQDDFAKYKKRAPVLKLQEIFRSVVFQAGEKFKYSKVSPTEPSQGYKDALELLIKAGLAHKIHHTSAQGIPLGAQIDLKKFKVIVFDTGIQQRLFGLDLAQYMVSHTRDLINKGSLAESFVGLEILKHQSCRLKSQLYYWHREAKSSNAEVDYVIQKGEQIIPVEVKSGTKGQMQSLFLFLKERKLPYGIRISHENFNRFDNIITYPIYAAEKLIGNLP